MWLSAALMLSLSGCDFLNLDENQYTVVCRNGHFVGKAESETGVVAFKGIPYAKAPVKELRWKDPQPADASDEVKKAYKFGKSSVQYELYSEPLKTSVGEDCLTLNIWTSDLSVPSKPVMVFFHGGSYVWGGTSEPIYSGQYIVSAHPDVIVVTCNYRLGLLGFNNLDGIPGGENYPHVQNLGVLDAMMSLQWVKENIAAFGGDPDNVTIFGESAGGGMVSALLNTDAAGSLFRRAIIQSGAANILFAKSDPMDIRQQGINALMQVTGCSTAQELASLSEKQWIKAIGTEFDEDWNTPSDFMQLPSCGAYPLHDDPYESLRSGSAGGVDILIGTNLDELNYWADEFGEKPLMEMNAAERQEAISIFTDWYIPENYSSLLSSITESERSCVAQYLSLYSDMEDYLAKSRLLGDVFYRQPSIKMAELHADAGAGKTYMYLFEKKNTNLDILGAGHSMELPYVFLNPNEQVTYGKVDMDFAHSICDAWVSFARTGNPSTASAAWPEYDGQDRKTMVFGNDCTLKVVSDPYSTERKLLQFTRNYNLRQSAGS